MICCVRSATRTDFSVGRQSASSMLLVCRDWVPPSTAASAWSVTRATLFSGCCAVSVEPAVWVWNRSICERGSFAPNRSRMIRAQSRRAARNFATSSRKLLCALKKNDSCGANFIHFQPRLDRRFHVGDGVGQGEGHFLHRRAPASRMW